MQKMEVENNLILRVPISHSNDSDKLNYATACLTEYTFYADLQDHTLITLHSQL